MNLQEALTLAVWEPGAPNKKRYLNDCESILNDTLREIERNGISNVEAFVQKARDMINHKKEAFFKEQQEHARLLGLYDERDIIITQAREMVKGDVILEYMLSAVLNGYYTNASITAYFKKQEIDCKGKEAEELLEDKLSRVEYDTNHIKPHEVVKDEFPELEEVIRLFEQKAQTIKQDKINAIMHTESLETLLARFRQTNTFKALQEENKRTERIKKNKRMLNDLKSKRPRMPDTLANIGERVQSNRHLGALFETYNERIADIERELEKDEHNSNMLQAVLSLRGNEHTDKILHVLQTLDALEEYSKDPMTSLSMLLEHVREYDSILHTAERLEKFIK